MADRIEKLIAEIAHELYEANPRVKVEDVVDQTRGRHGAVVRENASRLIDNAMRAAARRILKALSADEDEPEQLSLPGLTLPTVICVRTNGEPYYVDTRKATLEEVLAGRQERIDNIDAAEGKLRLFDSGLDIIRPYLEGHPRRTVEQAYRLAKKDGRL